MWQINGNRGGGPSFVLLSGGKTHPLSNYLIMYLLPTKKHGQGHGCNTDTRDNRSLESRTQEHDNVTIEYMKMIIESAYITAYLDMSAPSSGCVMFF